MTTENETVTTADLSGTSRRADDEVTPETQSQGATDQAMDQASETQETSQPLLSAEDGATFQTRWKDIQVGFVDEPQSAVAQADALVAELMQRLASQFAEERGRLEGEWERGEQVSTEDLRQALQHYRSFFQRLLAA
jgi:hypothetical protein